MALRAGFHGTVGQPSAQVIDGSLKFDNDKSQYLTRTPSSAGNRNVWTWSGWVKKSNATEQLAMFTAYGSGSNAGYGMLWFQNNGVLYFHNWDGQNNSAQTDATFRDTGWYHVVAVHDENEATEKMKFYVNGTLQSLAYNLTTSTGINDTIEHRIGMEVYNSRKPYDGSMSQITFIDGQALGPEYFGFTDPLTNTWRPKKYIPIATAPNTPNTVWSSMCSGTEYSSTYSYEKAFDGDTNTVSFASNGNTITFTPTGGITNSGNIVVTFDNGSVTDDGGSADFQINGSSVKSFFQTAITAAGGGSGSSRVATITGITNITSMSWSRVADNDLFGVRKIVVDGVTLVDAQGWGLNGFYLPMDGNSPIGQDKSGNGNDWTPVNFGGSNSLEKATGALPILNTDGGGKTASVGVRTDSNSSSLVLALPLVGNKEDVSNQINSGSTTKVVTANGNAAASSAQGNFYGGSYYFDGTDDTLTIPNNTDFNFGSGDSTIEMWVYPTRISATQENLITRGTSGYSGFIMSVTNFLDSTDGGSSWNVSITYDNPLIANKWQHIAVCRSGDTWTVYINGVANGSATASGTVQSSAETLTIGERTGQTDFQGYINDIRLYKGAAKYTQNFIPASTKPDILPDTPSGVSGGSKLTKITEGAVAFDGGDNTHLSIADSTDFDHASSFTWEGYFYLKSYDSGGSSILRHEDNGLDWYVNTSGNILFNQNTSTNLVNSGNGAMTLNKWVHIAVSHTGSVCKLFVDGVEKGSVTTSTVPDNVSGILYIGEAGDNNTYQWNGFISNLRFVNGTALYTSDFTPPAAPLTNVTNTKLLCCQSNAHAGAAVTSPNMGGVNDGTVWSSGAGANFEAARPATVGFDGDISTFTRTDNASVTATVTLPKSVAFTTLKVRGARDSGNGTITVNGVDVSSQFTSSSSTLETVTITGVSSPLTSIALTGISGSAQPRFSAIYVDDVILVDPLTPNGDAAATNFNPFNTDINTVRGQETGYCTMNPLGTSSNITLSNGNLSASMRSTAGHAWSMSNLSMGSNTGKYYMECTLTELRSGGQNISAIGLCHSGGPVDGWIGTAPSAVNHFNIIYNNGTTRQIFDANVVTSNYLTPAGAFTVGDVFQMAYDSDNKVGWFGINGFWYKADGTLGAVPSTGSNPTWVNFLYDEYFFTTDNHDSSYEYNYGQKPFKFPPPAGFQPLNAANVRPSTVIARPDKYVGVTTYTGSITDTSSQTVTGINFQSDLVWIKRRDGTNSHQLVDSVRGTGKWLESSGTAIENSTNTNGVLTSLNSNGFTLTGGSTNANLCCESGFTYVSWCWKAGGNKNTFNVDDVGYATASAAGLDGGTITPTGASVNTKSGFSIIRYTGGSNGASDSVPHGLGRTPGLILHKNLGATSNWNIKHSGFPSNYGAAFTQTQAQDVTTVYSGGGFADLTSDTTFGFLSGTSNANNVNESGADYICYIWADVPGLQKFGGYTANGLADGNFIELGFRPAILWIKATGSYTPGNWFCHDAARDTFNPTAGSLQLDSSNVEDTLGSAYYVDFLSNGFKLRANGNGENGASGYTYIYAAWAEAPSFNLYGGQSNAR